MTLLKLVFLQPKFTRMFLLYLCVFPENLFSILQELSELLIYELSNRALFTALRANIC